ncbi:predicted protein [Lichtheimia corymbifera JMRC:FSU:9682]|uniref:Uncharacterized protein n=1 Tax=Lichtheimia corymbifera JMRC:FSU:9682 TaxID=1263082 RepID=A0A068RVB8_9FUNG|nr:predicted protein [Lichtheimia corymbifera JMRC:FSU:9682]
MKQQIFGTLAFFYISAASAMPFLTARQDTTENSNHDDVSALVGTWYAGGMTENVKSTFDNMTHAYGFTCDCWHFDFTNDGGSSLKQKASCNVHKEGKLLGHAEVVGSLEYSSHDDDEYTFDYTLEEAAFYPEDGSEKQQGIEGINYPEYKAHYKLLEDNQGLYEWVEYDNEVFSAIYGKDHAPDDNTFDKLVSDLDDDDNQHVDIIRVDDKC